MEGDDTDFLDMLDRDVAALRAAAGEIDSLLAGMDLGAALSDSLSTANLASLNTDEIAQALSEGAAGVGDAMGAEIGRGLESSLGPAGVLAGDEIAQAIVEGASGTGDAVGAQLASELDAGAERAGGQAGEILAESLVGPVSLLGSDISAILSQGLQAGLPQVDAQVSDLMRQLPATVAPDATYAGLQIGGALAAGLAGMGGAAAAAIKGALVGVGGGIEAQLTDSLTQAGQSAGPSLAAGISAGATGGAGSVAGEVGRAIEARLTDALTEAGGPAGDALMAGIQAGAASSAASAAVKIGEALQVPLESEMTLLGGVAGDAFSTGLGESTAGGSAGGPGGAIVAEFAQAAPEVEQSAEELGQKAATSFGTGWQTRQGLIPYGGAMEPDELMNMGQQQDTFVPNLEAGQGAWILASKTGAKQAADAAWAAYGDELAGLVIPPERFLALTDTGVRAWTEEVAAQAAISGEGFTTAFADAMTMGMAGIDWEALTDAQAGALGAAMRGGIAAAAPEVDTAMAELGVSETEALKAAVASTGSGVADALIAEIVVARQAATDELVKLAVAAGEQGDAAGGRFAKFFSDAAAGLKTPFEKDPEKAVAAAAEAGAAAADAMVAQIEERLGTVPEAAAEEGAASGSAFGRFFTSAVDGVLAVFAKDPAAAAGGEAGSVFADAMLTQLEARLGEFAGAGDATFAQAVEAQLEVQLSLAAAEATAVYEQQLADGLATAEAEAVAQLGEMRLDVNLDRMFSNLTQTLPAEFVNAFSQVRQGIAVTEEEFAQFSETGQQQLRALVTVLQTDGVQAADQFMSALSTKSFNDRLDPQTLMAGGSAAEGLARAANRRRLGAALQLQRPLAVARVRRRRDPHGAGRRARHEHRHRLRHLRAARRREASARVDADSCSTWIRRTRC